MDFDAIGRATNDIEMGGAFTLTLTGEVRPEHSIYVPEVWHSETSDIDVMGEGWEALTGMTGQYAYNGACMHPSEYIGAGIARRLVEMVEDAGHPLTFAIVTVDDVPPMFSDRVAELQAASGLLSWGETAEIESAFAELDPSTLRDHPENAALDDMLEELADRAAQGVEAIGWAILVQTD